MLEELYELIRSAGVQRMLLSLQSEREGHLSVVVQNVLQVAPDSLSNEAASLRQALATPVVISGFPGEVDAQFSLKITEYVHSVKPQADKLTSNASERAKAVRDAGAHVAEPDQIGERTESTDQPPIGIEDDRSMALATGEADSL